jgi:protease-4
MKDFIKYTFATVTGLIITSVLLFIIGILIITGMTVSSGTGTTIESNSVFMLDLNGQLVERNTDNMPLKKIFSQVFESNARTIGLDEILSGIKKAKENKDIKGIYLQATKLGASFASLQEIREALADFKKSGKFIIAYSDSYSEGMYYLASVANKVFLNPQGAVDWGGISAELMFFKGTLDKLGVEMQIFKVGTFKSAVEPYTSTSMSDANRLQMNEMLQSLWGVIKNDVSKSRKIDMNTLNAYADNRSTTFYPAQQSVQCKLVDGLMYKTDMRDYLKKMVGIDSDASLNVLGITEMDGVKKDVPKDKSGDVIAVYYASGDIVDEKPTSPDAESIVGDDMVADLRDLKEDDDVKAVVIRVNSPGGSAFASEQIWHAIQELKAKKPVVVSMSDYAASGGYYISCGASKIVASPSTITGSIGIFGMIPNFGKLATKVGLSFDVVKTNKLSDFGGGSTRAMTDEEKALLQMQIVNGYNTFVKRCADGRHMTRQSIENIAQGRVWTGERALKLGLVDELGTFDHAIDVAAKLAKLGGYSIATYPETNGFMDMLFEETPDNYIHAQILKGRLGEFYQSFNLIQSLENQSVIQARMPYSLRIR